jgi:hypothetical protein
MTFNFSKVPNFGKVTTYPSAIGTTDFVIPEFFPGDTKYGTLILRPLLEVAT